MFMASVMTLAIENPPSTNEIKAIVIENWGWRSNLRALFSREKCLIWKVGDWEGFRKRDKCLFFFLNSFWGQNLPRTPVFLITSESLKTAYLCSWPAPWRWPLKKPTSQNLKFAIWNWALRLDLVLVFPRELLDLKSGIVSQLEGFQKKG